jgi:hypothetical protein
MRARAHSLPLNTPPQAHCCARVLFPVHRFLREVHNLFLGLHRLFLRSPQLVLRSPQLVLRKSTTCSVHSPAVDPQLAAASRPAAASRLTTQAPPRTGQSHAAAQRREGTAGLADHWTDLLLRSPVLCALRLVKCFLKSFFLLALHFSALHWLFPSPACVRLLIGGGTPLLLGPV